MPLCSFSPFVFRTIMEKYDLSEAYPFCWEQNLSGRCIEINDLPILVRCVAFSYEGHLLERIDKKSARHRYRCVGCDADDSAQPFLLYFMKRDDGFYLVPENSHFCHNTAEDKHNRFVISSNHNGMMDIYCNSPLLQNYFKAHIEADTFKDATCYNKVMAYLATTRLRNAEMSASTFSRICYFFLALYMEEQKN